MSSTKQLNQSVKKINTPNSKIGAVGFKDIEFYHQANAGDTVIDLTSLVIPTTALGEAFTNPPASTIIAGNIKSNRANLTLKSFRGSWMDRVDYSVKGQTQIILKQPAEENEVFHGVIHSVVRNQVENPDLQNLVAVGTLAFGQTDFNTGKAFRVNSSPLSQMGEVMVFRGNSPTIMLRNVGNATASSSSDGNYEEVGTGGYGQIIRFNEPCRLAEGELVIVVSTGRLIERPSNSMLQELEALQSYIDSIVPYVESLADLPAGTIKTAPTNVDLKSFGDKVVSIDTRVTALETPTTAVSAMYWVSANFTASPTVPVNFNTPEYDSHNAVTVSSTAWKFSCPTGLSGTYRVSMFWTLTAGGTFYFNVYKGGVIYKTLGYSISTSISGQASIDIRLNEGEYFDVRPGGSTTLSGNASEANNAASHISISRVGK